MPAPTTHPTRWRFERAVGRIEPLVQQALVEHATQYWMRPLRRAELGSGTRHDADRVVWTIDREPVLEFRFAERGPSSLIVHDFSLLGPVRRAIRTRHVRVRLATARDVVVLPAPSRFTTK